MARALVEALPCDLDPAAPDLADHYRDAVLAVVESRLAGTPPPALAAAADTTAGDLMAALTASLDRVRPARSD